MKSFMQGIFLMTYGNISYPSEKQKIGSWEFEFTICKMCDHMETQQEERERYSCYSLLHQYAGHLRLSTLVTQCQLELRSQLEFHGNT